MYAVPYRKLFLIPVKECLLVEGLACFSTLQEEREIGRYPSTSRELPSLVLAGVTEHSHRYLFMFLSV